MITLKEVDEYAERKGYALDTIDFFSLHQEDADWRESMDALFTTKPVCPKCGFEAEHVGGALYACHHCPPLSRFEDCVLFML